MSNDMWVKMAEFLGNLNGENVNRESYIRTPEYEEALTAWRTLRLFRREGPISRDMRTVCRCCFIWDY